MDSPLDAGRRCGCSAGLAALAVDPVVCTCAVDGLDVEGRADRHGDRIRPRLRAQRLCVVARVPHASTGAHRTGRP